MRSSHGQRYASSLTGNRLLAKIEFTVDTVFERKRKILRTPRSPAASIVGMRMLERETAIKPAR